MTVKSCNEKIIARKTQKKIEKQRKLTTN